MSILDHWHPIAKSRDLRQKPLAVSIAGTPIALFRTQTGNIGAVADACPHRRLKLSVGRVVGERLQCAYHGWSFGITGDGESPGTPKLTTCVHHFDVREKHELIWVKSRESDAQFPKLDIEGYFPIAVLEHNAPAPLELTVDNFNEIEHSGTVHRTFGYDLERMSEVSVRFESNESSLRVVNVGPTKRLGLLYSWYLGAYPNDLFHDDWTMRFSPVHMVVDHWWTSRTGSRESKIRWRLFMFFVPIDDKNTKVISMTYAKSRYPGPAGGLRLIRWRFRQELDLELIADTTILGHLATHDCEIEGMKLSRFDKGLGLARERIARLYRKAVASE